MNRLMYAVYTGLYLGTWMIAAIAVRFGVR
jgi:hypothetical protein